MGHLARRASLWLCLLFFVCIAARVSAAQAITRCPSASGVYALNGAQWIALPVARASKEKLRTGFPYHGVAIAVYKGSSSTVALGRNMTLCVSNAPLGTTFALAKAKQKKNNREVKVGTYGVFNSTWNFNVDKSEAVAIEEAQQHRPIILHVSNLSDGQYILYVQSGSSIRTVPPGFDFFVQ